MDLKMVILVRADLKLPKGKLAAQAAHAAVEAAHKSAKHDKPQYDRWRREGQKKVVLKVSDEKELLSYFQAAKDSGLVTSLITDAGRTCIAPGTRTCVAIGPDLEDNIDKLTGELSMV